MKISSIVAVSENGVIGIDGNIPWEISEDLKFFKKTTMDHPIIMGRKTHESIGKSLPGRVNIVLTRDENYLPKDGALVVTSMEAALSLSEALGVDPFIIGGSQIYKLAMPHIDRIIMTLVRKEVSGDTFFPWLAPSEWKSKIIEKFYSEDMSYDFIELSKKGK